MMGTHMSRLAIMLACSEIEADCVSLLLPILLLLTTGGGCVCAKPWIIKTGPNDGPAEAEASSACLILSLALSISASDSSTSRLAFCNRSSSKANVPCRYSCSAVWRRTVLSSDCSGSIGTSGVPTAGSDRVRRSGSEPELETGEESRVMTKLLRRRTSSDDAQIGGRIVRIALRRRETGVPGLRTG